MYRGYEPNAIMIEASGRIVRLFTYDACSSLKEAKQVIKNGMKIMNLCLHIFNTVGIKRKYVVNFMRID